MSNGTSGFEFPGFKCLDNYGTSTHMVVEGTIEDGGAVFGLTLIRNKSFQDLPFVLARVADGSGQTIWTFKDQGFDGVGLLAKAGDTAVVALCGKGKNGAVERVIPLSQLVGGKQIDLRSTIALKGAAADFLKKKVKLADIEQKLFDLDEARRQAAESEARQAARNERIMAIQARGTITVYDSAGKKLFGAPVTKHEWMSLDDGAYAVLVDSIDANGKVEGVQEWFRVVKERGRNPQKENARPVMAQRPEAAKAVAMKPVRTSFIDTKKGAFEVLLFGSKDDILKAATAGLNSGTHVAVNAVANEQVEIYTLHDGKMKSAGKHALLA